LREPLAPAVQGSRIPLRPGESAQPVTEGETAMAKGQMRVNKEKKKPKQDKDKKKGTSAYAQAYHAQPSSNPIIKKD
jgi:hypothetical protein